MAINNNNNIINWDNYDEKVDWSKNIDDVKLKKLELFIEIQLCAIIPPKGLDPNSWNYLLNKTKKNHILILFISDEPYVYELNPKQLINDMKESMIETNNSEQEIPFIFTEYEGFGNIDENPIPKYNPIYWKNHKYYAWCEIIVDFEKEFKTSKFEEVLQAESKLKTIINATPGLSQLLKSLI